ncbi:MAG TPA: MerR family DNA-binding protein [Burkholderiaceae bacterium]|jgi:Hg(II)-responsive transcriptional regulator|nr:MerR family DNA-binding protein [Burkholderiaceae bacterium]
MNARNHNEMNNSEDGLTIGRLAKAAQVGIETIRYYQRLNLLPTPAPVRNAFRHYPLSMVERIRFIKRAQDLGFSLEDIATLLQLNDGADRHQVRQLANARLESIRVKIADLSRMESILSELVQECEHAGHARSCPIIDAFSGIYDISSGEQT